MIGYRDRFAYVVAETGKHHLVICACSLSHRGGLEAVSQLVGEESVADIGQRLQQHQYPICYSRLVYSGAPADVCPLFGGRLIHSSEAVVGCCGCGLGDSHTPMLAALP